MSQVAGSRGRPDALCHHLNRRSGWNPVGCARCRVRSQRIVTAANPERSRHCDRPQRGAARVGSQDVPAVAALCVDQARAWTPARGERRPSARMRTYPFTAVVGSDDMALALALTTVSPGGRRRAGARREGHREIHHGAGAGRPAAGRRRRRRLPVLLLTRPTPTRTARTGRTRRRRGSHRRPARLVELPVGATEDRVIGSLHLERALTAGVTEYEPGLLAAAHRGLLYVDEVNLLHDHLVDLLLDAAAMGRSTVEREGVSIAHASRFVLVGTMNPEEGELRPQLLDRFGLTVEIAAPRDPQSRVEVVRRRLAYDADPDGFAGRYADSEDALAERVVRRPGGAADRGARRRRADQDRRGVRGVRGRRHARRHRHRPGRRRARRLARPAVRRARRHQSGRPAGAAAPSAAQSVRCARAGRGAAGSDPGRRGAGSRSRRTAGRSRRRTEPPPNRGSGPSDRAGAACGRAGRARRRRGYRQRPARRCRPRDPPTADEPEATEPATRRRPGARR